MHERPRIAPPSPLHRAPGARRPRGLSLRPIPALVCATLLCGCAMSREDQLEAVARDWCMTIRASQVIPVYPLTEDIQPGDIFLVQTPVDDQKRIYKTRGFLPLDNHIARLDPSGYAAFYDHSFLLPPAGPGVVLPATWTHTTNLADSWKPAPNAAFPSYSFSVRSGAGLNLAVPISGIPIGLSLLGTHSADGSVAIERARTIGVDTVSLYENLKEWGLLNQEFLKAYGPGPDGVARNYLRVITRIYATGRVDVSLSDARSVSAGADAGVPRPVDLIAAKAPTTPGEVPQNTIDNYARNLSALNAMLAEAQLPTRASGSDIFLDIASTDAKTRAKIEALEEARKEKEKLRAEAAEKLAAASPGADAASRAIAENIRKLEAARAARQAIKVKQPPATDAEIKAADDAIAKAESDLAGARTSGQDALDKRAAAEGRLEVANTALVAATQSLPGGSLRVTAASSRFISMRQEFTPPLVIGYLAFDAEIRAGGEIGPPIPTHALVDPKTQGEPFKSQEAIEVLFASSLPREAVSTLRQVRSTDERAAAALDALNALAATVPDRYEVYDQAEGGALGAFEEQVRERDYRAYLAYDAAVRKNFRLIGDRLASGQEFRIAGRPDAVRPDSPEWRRLNGKLEEWSKWIKDTDLAHRARDARVRAGNEYVRLLVARTRG